MQKTVTASGTAPSAEGADMMMAGLKPFLTTAMTAGAALVAGALLLLLVQRMIKPKKRDATPKNNVTKFDQQPKTKAPRRLNPANTQDQMAIVAKSNYQPQKIMNVSEYRLFDVIERALPGLGKGYRLMAQVSLGEIIKPAKAQDSDTARDANKVINSKRVDMVIVDPKGYVALAVEYQGSGHHQQNAFLRDAVKREALRRAGIQMLEIEEAWTPELVTQQVSNALRPKT